MKSLFRLALKYLHIIIFAYLSAVNIPNYQEGFEKTSEINERFSGVEQQIIRNKKKLKKIKKFKKDIVKKEKELETIVKQIEEVQKQLPDVINDTDILNIFDEEAEKVGIQDVQMKPLSEQSRGFYFAKRYKFMGTATFLQFLIYFERLSKNERLINVTDMKLENKKIKQRGRFQLINLTTEMEIFRYNTSYRETGKDSSKKSK